MPLDIHLSPLYRIQGQEQAEMPGVLAWMPPKTAARGREQDRLIVYLALTGNATLTVNEYRAFAEDVANVFYQTPRAVTSALRTAADWLNKTLLERNMASSSRGQYTLAWLALAVIRENQCIFSLSGPMHAYAFSASGSRHFFEPSISGKGLGSGQTINLHYAQTDLAANDQLLFCARVPNAWQTPLTDAQPSSFDAMRRRLTALTSEDLNAVLVHAVNGSGSIHLIKGLQSPKVEEVVAAPIEEPVQEETPAPPAPLPASNPLTSELVPAPEVESTSAHVLQPSAYSIAPQQPEPASNPLASLPQTGKTVPRVYPASIPRAQPQTAEPSVEKVEAANVQIENIEKKETPAPVEVSSAPVEQQPAAPREPSPQTRQAAKVIVNVMQSARRLSATAGERFRNFLPRLLPGSETTEPSSISSNAFMLFMAMLIPLIVVTVLSVVYLRYGRNEQYDAYLQQAQEMRQQALSLTNPVEQRIAWENVLGNVEQAEKHRQTEDTINLKNEAQTQRDTLLGIIRLQFNPAFSTSLDIDVSRMAAGDSDLYLLNAENGEVLRALPSGNGGFELDTTFRCKPGDNNSVGPLVDILPLPINNIYGATVLGIDVRGNLLYCKPGNNVAQFAQLPVPDTNWGRVTSFVLDGNSLYVLDADSRAVWVYIGKDGTFLDAPYFFFGQQTPAQDATDFVVSGDEMFLLHGDGRSSNCFYSRNDISASKCKDPLPYFNPFPAYADTNLFAETHFTQILFAAPPDPSILILDSDGQSVMRFTPRTLELQSQYRPTTGNSNPIPAGPVSAVAVSPDHVLFFAVNRQVYFAVNMP